MAVGSAPASAFDLSERKLAAAHDALMHTRGLQFDFHAVPPPPKPPNWLGQLFEFLAGLGPVMKFVFWGGVAVGGALIVWVIAREVLAARRGARVRPEPAQGWRPEPAQAQRLLEDADRLAAEGRFGEAIHLILFRSIDDIAGRRPGLVRPALTSRDIAHLDAVPDQARAAFARIGRAVELNVFAGRVADAEVFRACRGDYETFAFPESWS